MEHFIQYIRVDQTSFSYWHLGPNGPCVGCPRRLSKPRKSYFHLSFTSDSAYVSFSLSCEGGMWLIFEFPKPSKNPHRSVVLTSCHCSKMRREAELSVLGSLLRRNEATIRQLSSWKFCRIKMDFSQDILVTCHERESRLSWVLEQVAWHLLDLKIPPNLL